MSRGNMLTPGQFLLLLIGIDLICVGVLIAWIQTW